MNATSPVLASASLAAEISAAAAAGAATPLAARVVADVPKGLAKRIVACRALGMDVEYLKLRGAGAALRLKADCVAFERCSEAALFLDGALAALRAL